MTVKELIEKLQALPFQDVPIYFVFDTNCIECGKSVYDNTLDIHIGANAMYPSQNAWISNTP